MPKNRKEKELHQPLIENEKHAIKELFQIFADAVSLEKIKDYENLLTKYQNLKKACDKLIIKVRPVITPKQTTQPNKTRHK